jgi:hypothetical protein
VITVHRMLRNSVPEYLLVSDAVYERLEPALRERSTRITEELEGVGETELHFVDLKELAGEIPEPEPSVAGRVRETATVLGRGMPYLLGLKNRGLGRVRMSDLPSRQTADLSAYPDLVVIYLVSGDWPDVSACQRRS